MGSMHSRKAERFTARVALASQCLSAPRAIGILSPEWPMEICSVLMETAWYLE